MSRAANLLLPPSARTVHILGDVHCNGPTELATSMRPSRRQCLVNDFATGRYPPPLAHFSVGDLAHRGTAAGDADAQALSAELTRRTGAPFHPLAGNHDLYGNVRRGPAWATAWGLPSYRYTVDLPFARCLMLSPYEQPLNPDGSTSLASILLTSSDLAWLDTELAEVDGPCWIFCHAPLYDPAFAPSTTAAGYVKPDSTVRGILAAHPNAQAWFSGHTHSEIDEPNLIGSLALTGRDPIACIRLPGIVNCLHNGDVLDWSTDWQDRMFSLWVTHAGDHLEVRFRDHGAGVWDGPNSQRVTTIPIY